MSEGASWGSELEIRVAEGAAINGSNDGTRRVVPVTPGPAQTTAIHISLRARSRAVKKSGPGAEPSTKADGRAPPATADWAYLAYAANQAETDEETSPSGIPAGSKSEEISSRKALASRLI
jgi:hypothetical protein